MYITSKWISACTGGVVAHGSIPSRTSNYFYNIMLDKIKSYFGRGDDRTKTIKINVFQSFIYKGLSIILSLLIVPLTIGFVNAEQYGIWLTISSIVGWIGYFDLGLGHGLRNKYTEAKARGDKQLISELVSTAYVLIALIFTCVFVVFSIINHFINWNSFLGIYQIDNGVLQEIMFILLGFFCLNMVLGVLKSLLLGDQRTSMTSLLVVLDQLCSLVVIFVLTKTVKPDLQYLVFVYSGAPCLVTILFSFFLFVPSKSVFHDIRPRIRNVRLILSKSLLSLGGKFFIIQLSLLIIFQCVNIIISRNCGQIAVTQYNLSYKYFQILYMVSIIILTPYWSAFSDAYTRNDYEWMNKSFKTLTRFMMVAVPILIFMLLIAPIFFKIWVGDRVNIPFQLNLMVSFYVFSQILSGMHTYIINGLGKITLQLVLYVIFSLLSIPVMNYLSLQFGVYGILSVLTFVYSTQALFCRIQIKKILNNRAFGIWNM